MHQYFQFWVKRKLFRWSPAIAQIGGSRASHNLEVTTQRDEVAGLAVLPGPGAGLAALEWSVPAGPSRWPEGLRERFLPECAFRGRRDARFRYAVLAAAGIHGGTGPDLLEEIALWQTGDFWQYAMCAAVACTRTAASRAGVPVRQVCQDLDERPGHPALPARCGVQAGATA